MNSSGGLWSCSAFLASLANASFRPEWTSHRRSHCRSVVFPRRLPGEREPILAPHGEQDVLDSGSPANSFRSSDAMRTAIGRRVEEPDTEAPQRPVRRGCRRRLIRLDDCVYPCRGVRRLELEASLQRSVMASTDHQNPVGRQRWCVLVLLTGTASRAERQDRTESRTPIGVYAGLLYYASTGVFLRLFAGSQGCRPCQSRVTWNRRGQRGPLGPEGPRKGGRAPRAVRSAGETGGQIDGAQGPSDPVGAPWARGACPAARMATGAGVVSGRAPGTGRHGRCDWTARLTGPAGTDGATDRKGDWPSGAGWATARCVPRASDGPAGPVRHAVTEDRTPAGAGSRRANGAGRANRDEPGRAGPAGPAGPSGSQLVTGTPSRRQRMQRKRTLRDGHGDVPCGKGLAWRWREYHDDRDYEVTGLARLVVSRDVDHVDGDGVVGAGALGAGNTMTVAAYALCSL